MVAATAAESEPEPGSTILRLARRTNYLGVLVEDFPVGVERHPAGFIGVKARHLDRDRRLRRSGRIVGDKRRTGRQQRAQIGREDASHHVVERPGPAVGFSVFNLVGADLTRDLRAVECVGQLDFAQRDRAHRVSELTGGVGCRLCTQRVKVRGWG